MGDGIQWLAGGIERAGSVFGVVLARGIDAEELAVRMGAVPGSGTDPITDAQVSELGMEIYRPGADGDGVVRVGRHGNWAFAFEYGDCPGLELLEEVSREGVEVIHYTPVMEHPPAIISYAHDGRHICGFGLGEERIRWGEEPDWLLADLVAAGILNADGSSYGARADGDHTARDRRTLAVVEARFGLELPPELLTEARLPAYAVRGNPQMSAKDRDYAAIAAWAAANGYQPSPRSTRQGPNGTPPEQATRPQRPQRR